MEILKLLVEKIKKNYRKFMGLDKGEYVNPNKPIKMSLLSSTFEKIIMHKSKKLNIIHDLLEYMNAFIMA